MVLRSTIYTTYLYETLNARYRLNYHNFRVYILCTISYIKISLKKLGVTLNLSESRNEFPDLSLILCNFVQSVNLTDITV